LLLKEVSAIKKILAELLFFSVKMNIQDKVSAMQKMDFLRTYVVFVQHRLVEALILAFD
jgi:hypothetical protein